MVGNDTVRGNGLTEILPICRVSKVRTCSNDMSLVSVRRFISTRLPFYKMFRPISFALNVTKYFSYLGIIICYVIIIAILFISFAPCIYKLSFSKDNHLWFFEYSISREKILFHYTHRYKKFLKIFDYTFDYIPWSWFYSYISNTTLRDE